MLGGSLLYNPVISSKGERFTLILILDIKLVSIFYWDIEKKTLKKTKCVFECF